MRGWLVYSPEGYEINRWFADRLVSSAKTEGLDISLKIVPRGSGLPQEPLPCFAIVRAIRTDLSIMLESNGVRVFNNAMVSRIANDKWRTFLLAKELGLDVLPTVSFSYPGKPQTAFPFVVKSLDGHGGAEVFIARRDTDLAAIAARTGKRTFIAQEVCDEPGVDMRVYVLGGRAVAAVRRESRTDFRSNFKLGGEVAQATPSAGQIAAIERLHRRLGFDFAGVDFMRHGGSWVFNEIEDVAGTRMLYATTDLDPAAMFIHHVHMAMHRPGDRPNAISNT